MAHHWGYSLTDLYTGQPISTNSSVDGGHYILDKNWHIRVPVRDAAVRVSDQDKAATPAKREIPPRFDLARQG